MAIRSFDSRVDAATVIDDATFRDIVRRTVGAVLAAYGYGVTMESNYRVRFEKPGFFVDIAYDAQRSKEVSIWLGDRSGDGEPPLELADALRASGGNRDDIQFAELIQTSDPDALFRLLGRVAQLLSEHAGQLMAGGTEAFNAARALRSQRAAAYTAKLRNSRALEAADAAWARKDFGQVRDLLGPIREELDETNRRRLELAEDRL